MDLGLGQGTVSNNPNGLFNGTQYGADNGQFSGVFQNISKGIIKEGLVLRLDASNLYSAPLSGGIIWKDLSLRNRVSTLNNNPLYNFNQKGSLTFNGSNQWVSTNLGVLTTYAGTTPTVSIWFKTNTTATRQTLIGDYNNAGGSETTRIEISSTLTGIPSNYIGGTINAASGAAVVTSINPISANVWYNISIQRDANNIYLYLNGILQQTLATVAVAFGGGGTSIGRAGLFNGLYFNGNIASVLIYNRCLSPNETMQNFYVTKKKFGI
jgi:hypothetical protein